MVLSTTQQVALALTAALCCFVLPPRMFGGGGGGAGAKEARFDPRSPRRGGAQSPENLQQMKKLMEHELSADKYKSGSSNNNHKGYVFTLMPLYAIGVGVFAAYKFLKMKSADDQAQKEQFAKGSKKSAEAEKQLNELEQRLAHTERMLSSILTELDPLTSCVKTVAQEQKNELMSQLKTIRCLMKKRGMDCSPLNTNDASCDHNLDDLIESLGAKETSEADAPPAETHTSGDGHTQQEPSEEAAADEEDTGREVVPEEQDRETDGEGDEEGRGELMPSLEDSSDTDTEEAEVEPPASGLRRRIRPE